LHLTSTEKLRRNKELRGLIAHELDFGRAHAIKAVLPGRGNFETSDELSVLVSQLYQSHLYEEGQKFNGEILCMSKDGGFASRR